MTVFDVADTTVVPALLSGMLNDAKLRDILVQAPQLEDAANRLIEMANAAGGTDNVTCVLTRYHRA